MAFESEQNKPDFTVEQVERAIKAFHAERGEAPIDFTVENLERAIRVFHAEHGTYPKQNGGDASKYLGWPQPDQWSNVNACIRNGARGLEALKEFGSLRGYCTHLGLKNKR